MKIKSFMITKMSGVWRDFHIQTTEDQQKAYVPVNEITETLWYNQRLLLDTNLQKEDSEPRAWLISKVNRVAPKGICNITMAQEKFDQHNDYIERDEDGNVIGMWADYYRSGTDPTPIGPQESTSIFSSITSKITYSGNSNLIRVGGYKIFTVNFYEEDTPVDFINGEWTVLIDGESVSDQVEISYPAENKIKVKLSKDDSLIGKMLSVIYTSGDIVSSSGAKIIAL